MNVKNLTSLCAVLGILASAHAQSPSPGVFVTDRGAHTSIARPGAPTNIVGLPRTTHDIVMNTGIKKYSLRYVVAHDPKRPGVAIPGEGYIGMSQPTSCNWYAGGFFDLRINGKSIGSTPIHSLVWRSVGNHGQVDFVFDTSQSLVRLRFVTLVGSDALHCQLLLEPKTEIKSLRLLLRCYPSAFVSNAERHVLTAMRDLKQGDRAELDLAKESWLLYYDRIFDAGHISPSGTGRGPCSVLWTKTQASKIGFTIGNYGFDTVMDLKPSLRDFRFVFFDYKGTKNEVAKADLRARADGLLRDLPTFSFAVAGIADWALAQKKQEIARIFAAMPDEKEAAAQYRTWAAELARQLELVRSGAAGAVMAEAGATNLIQQWDRGLADLRLKALLKGI